MISDIDYTMISDIELRVAVVGLPDNCSGEERPRCAEAQQSSRVLQVARRSLAVTRERERDGRGVGVGVGASVIGGRAVSTRGDLRWSEV